MHLTGRLKNIVPTVTVIENRNKLKAHATETNRFITKQINWLHCSRRWKEKLNFTSSMNYQPVNAHGPFLPMATASVFAACVSMALSMPCGSKISCMRFFTHVAVETESVSRVWWRTRIRLILLHFYGSIGIRLIQSCPHSLHFPANFARFTIVRRAHKDEHKIYKL